MTTKQQRMYTQIVKHGENLIALFNLPPDTEPVKLCKALLRIENALHRAYENYCSIQDYAPEPVERLARAKLCKLITPVNADRIIFNRDPRGYALKIDLTSNEKLYTDWGGYGIIAPTFGN